MASGCTTSKGRANHMPVVSRFDRQISEMPEGPVLKRVFVFADLLLCM